MLLTVSSAAKILKTSEGTVRRLERSGELPAQRTSSGVRLFDRADVDRLARERAERRTLPSSPKVA
jgi:excisionase family DNA binding protein